MNPAYIPNYDSVQHPDARYMEITMAQFVARGNVVDLELPANCELVSGHIVVTDTYNSTGTDTIKIGDSVDDDRYLAATNLKAAARTALTPTGFIHGINGNPPNLRITRTPADAAATKGTVRIYFQTAALGKAYHTQG